MFAKTILITGGSGFLGINLLSYILKTEELQGVKVIVLDNFLTSSKQTLRSFLSALPTASRDAVDVVELDCCHHDLVSIMTSRYDHVDEIYHLASVASPPLYKKFPVETLNVGYIGTRNMLDLCLHFSRQAPCRMMFASTSEVYGDALQHPQSEEYYGNVNSYGQRSCYDESKRVGEALMYTYNRLHGLQTRIVRIFNTYGPFMNLHDGRIVTEIIKSILLGNPLEIFGTGLQTRSLSYVDDTIVQIVSVMRGEHSGPVNVGSDCEICVNDLVEVVKRVYKHETGCDPELRLIHTDNKDKDDPKVRRPCLSLNSQVVGQLDKTRLEDGLQKTLVYFKKHLHD